MTNFTVIQGGDCPDDKPSDWEGDLEQESAVDFQGRASNSGRDFKHRTEFFLVDLGAQIDSRARAVSAYKLDFEIHGSNGQRFGVLAHGTFDDEPRPGLQRTDTVKKMGYDAIQIRKRLPLPLIAITSHLPKPGFAAAQLADAQDALFDVIAINDDVRGIDRLRKYLHDDPLTGRLPAAWRDVAVDFSPNLFDPTADPEER